MKVFIFRFEQNDQFRSDKLKSPKLKIINSGMINARRELINQKVEISL